MTAPSLLAAAGVDPERARAILAEALAGADDGNCSSNAPRASSSRSTTGG